MIAINKPIVKSETVYAESKWMNISIDLLLYQIEENEMFLKMLK